MDDLLCGDPAVRPISVAGSMPTEKNNETGKSSDRPSLKPPKRRRVQAEPTWVVEYRAELRAMHNERMALEREKLQLEARRVAALEKILQKE